MPKFKELKSGLVYEYNSAWDVEQMRKHPEYQEIKEDATGQPVVAQPTLEDKPDGYGVADSKRGPKKAS